jgi:hypothetical protein
LLIGGAHIARRTAAAEIDPRSDRMLKFHGKSSTTVAAGSMVVSDPAELEVPGLSDLAISLFLPQRTEAKTSHSMAKQTSYISTETGDSTAAVKFPVAKAIHSWPFLTGVDVELRRVQQLSWRLALRSRTETEPQRTQTGVGLTCLPSVCRKALEERWRLAS